MPRNGPPEFYIRRVQYVREEYQVIKSLGNQKAYIDPVNGKGDYHTRQASLEQMEILEPLRLLTESEAGILGLPFEGERVNSTDIVNAR